MTASSEADVSPNGFSQSSFSASHEPVAEDPVSARFRELFDGVEDLLKRVADIESPDIQKIRAKVRVALMAAKSAAQDGATQVRLQALRAASTTDSYLRDYPWQALGLGVLLGFGVGVLVARRD